MVGSDLLFLFRDPLALLLRSDPYLYKGLIDIRLADETAPSLGRQDGRLV